MPKTDSTPSQRSVTGEPTASRIGQFSWAIFEFGRSPYLSLIYIFVFPPYFAAVVVGDVVRGQSYWSLANTLGGVAVAVLAPMLGAIADQTGARKPWLAVIVGVMALGCASLWFAVPPGQGGLSIGAIIALVIVLTASFQFTEVFHNAILPSIASESRIGKLSGLGISTGNLGTLVVLVLMLLLVALPANGVLLADWLPARPVFGLDPATHEHDRISGPVAAMWLLVFTLPLMTWTRDRASTGVSLQAAVRQGFVQLGETLRQTRRVSNVAFFLLARMLYTDGKTAILAYIGLYAAGTFGWQLSELLLFAILITPFSILGGYVGGWLDSRFGSKRAILISITVTGVALLVAVSIPSEASTSTVGPGSLFDSRAEVAFLLASGALGISITAAFCTSRVMMARIAPLPMINQFFGLYALSGTATAFLGHAIVGATTRISGSQRAGFASTLVLLVAGGVLLLKVKEVRAELA